MIRKVVFVTVLLCLVVLVPVLVTSCEDIAGAETASDHSSDDRICERCDGTGTITITLGDEGPLGGGESVIECATCDGDGVIEGIEEK